MTAFETARARAEPRARQQPIGDRAGCLGAVAIDKAVRSRAPAALAPGRYTVVKFLPAADLLGLLGWR